VAVDLVWLLSSLLCLPNPNWRPYGAVDRAGGGGVASFPSKEAGEPSLTGNICVLFAMPWIDEVVRFAVSEIYSMSASYVLCCLRCQNDDHPRVYDMIEIKTFIHNL